MLAGRLDGFRKILTLLVERDPALTREIAQTLKHFLDTQNDGELDEIRRRATMTARAVAAAAADASSNDADNDDDAATTATWRRLRGVASDITGFVVTELSRIWTLADYAGAAPKSITATASSSSSSSSSSSFALGASNVRSSGAASRLGLNGAGVGEGVESRDDGTQLANYMPLPDALVDAHSAHAANVMRQSSSLITSSLAATTPAVTKPSSPTTLLSSSELQSSTSLFTTTTATTMATTTASSSSSSSSSSTSSSSTSSTSSTSSSTTGRDDERDVLKHLMGVQGALSTLTDGKLIVSFNIFSLLFEQYKPMYFLVLLLLFLSIFRDSVA